MPPKKTAAKKKFTKEEKEAKNEKAKLVRKQGPVVLTPSERHARLKKIIEDGNDKFGVGCIGFSEDMNSSYLLRRPTGILSLDIALAGGWPAAAPSVLVGPEGVGKDYLLWRTAAEGQRIYGENFAMACYFTEFKPDKLYMKDHCGFQIAFSEDEIQELDRTLYGMGRPGLTEEQIDYYRLQIGEFIPIVGLTADTGFDTIFDILDSNSCQIVAVNSIGFLQTEAKEDTKSFEDFAQRSSEAALLTKVMPKFSTYMNRGCSIDGSPNESALILVNQVRANDQQKRPMKGMPVQEKDKYKSAVAAYALKHGKAIELMVHNGGSIYDDDTKLKLGRKKQWEILKGKLGTHEGLKGEFDHFYDFGVDILGDLSNVAVRLGVIKQSGAWYKMEEGSYKLNCQGSHKLLEVLKKEDELAEYVRTRCYQESGVTCRHQ